jgi:hypothetical protein
VTGDGATSVFTGRPQPVEIHHRGIWYSGELLGWRHEDGRVLARVRCTVDKLRHSAWKDLAELRLPDPAHPPRAEARAAALRRPVPAGRPASPDEDDETRPHALLAALSSRPARPVHAVTPPAPRRDPVGPSRTAPAQRRPDYAPTRGRADWDAYWDRQDALTAAV